jgi:hypothetical protein
MGKPRSCASAFAGIRQHLNDVVNGAVATAGEDGVTSGKDRLARFLLRLGPGVSENEGGIDASSRQKRQNGLQLGMAAFAPAAGIRVVEQSCLAHGRVEAGLYLSRFALGDKTLGKGGEFGISCGRLVRGASPCYSPSTACPQFRIEED